LLFLVLSGSRSEGGGLRAGGRTVDGQFRSAALGGITHYSVYLPAGYGSGRKRYPVIYFLHGLPAADAEYRSDRIVKIGKAAEARRHPSIVIGAQGARAGDSDPEWHDWGAGRNWETATSDELVGYVDSHFRTIRDRRARALIGVSAGGYGATMIAVHHPGLYSVAQSWSGYFHATDPDGSAPLELGSIEKDQEASAHTYVLRQKELSRRYGPLTFGFYVGDADSFLPENEQLHQELVAAGVWHLYARYPGAHTPQFWDEHQAVWVADAVDALEQAS
jgi:enterochelin esterase-like enzyme